jgi:hypothetical protein
MRFDPTGERDMKALLLCLAASLAASSSAQAAETKISGEIPFKVVYHDQTELADGRVVSRDHLKGTIKSTDGSGLFDGSSQDCFGAIVFAVGGEKIVEGHGSCDAIDTDGDVWWLTWTTEKAGESMWTMVGGTGKYKGLTGSGKTTFTMETFKVADNATPSALLARYEGTADLQ